MEEGLRAQRYFKGRLTRGFGWALAGRIGVAVASLAASAALTRVLPPAEVGVFFLAMSLVSGATILAQLGIPQTIVRLVPEALARREPWRAGSAVRKAIALGSVGAASVGTLLILAGRSFAASVLGSEELAELMPLLACWLLFLALQGIVAEIYRGFDDIREASILGPFSSSTFAAILLWGMYLWGERTSLFLAVTIYTIASAATICLGLGLLTRKRGQLRAGPRRPTTAATVFAIALPLLVTSLTLFVLNHADIWILASFKSTTDVATYSAATRLVNQVVVPLALVNAFLPPIIVELSSAARITRLQDTLRLTTTLAACPAVLVLAGYWLGGEPVLTILYGPYYRNAKDILIVLSAGQLVNVVSGSSGLVLALLGRQITLMKISLFSGVFTVATAVVLVQYLGAMGVAVATAVGTVTQSALMLWKAKQRCGIWTYAYFSPTSIKASLRALSDEL